MSSIKYVNIVIDFDTDYDLRLIEDAILLPKQFLYNNHLIYSDFVFKSMGQNYLFEFDFYIPKDLFKGYKQITHKFVVDYLKQRFLMNFKANKDYVQNAFELSINNYIEKLKNDISINLESEVIMSGNQDINISYLIKEIF
jgi:hypothetical protein